MTNDLLKKNSEMLHTSTVEVAKESERGIVDIETLKQTNETLIKTFDEVLQIQAEGRQKRAEAEVEMRRIEAELKQKMLEADPTSPHHVPRVCAARKRRRPSRRDGAFAFNGLRLRELRSNRPQPSPSHGWCDRGNTAAERLRNR